MIYPSIWVPWFQGSLVNTVLSELCLEDDSNQPRNPLGRSLRSRTSVETIRGHDSMPNFFGTVFFSSIPARVAEHVTQTLSPAIAAFDHYLGTYLGIQVTR